MQALSTKPARLARGFTLPELMVAITIGLLILAGMTTLFVRNSRAQAEIEKSNRQIENGRFAIDQITADLRNAGFYGEFDPTPMATPPKLPDPCANTAVVQAAALPLPVQGYGGADAVPTCVQDQLAGTDMLVVRHTRPCIYGAADCQEDVANPLLFQASLCDNNSELDSATVTDYFKLDTASINLNRHKRDCTTLADSRRYEMHIYFVANNDNDGDGIPTLKRAELRANADGSLAFAIVPLVEGIENMQLEYGVDTDGDGHADLFSATPGTLNACADPAAACVPANWRNVVSVRISLLARNTEPTIGYTDNRSYTLGTGNVIAARKDNFKRHVFQTLVPLPNPIGRKQS